MVAIFFFIMLLERRYFTFYSHHLPGWALVEFYCYFNCSSLYSLTRPPFSLFPSLPHSLSLSLPLPLSRSLRSFKSPSVLIVWKKLDFEPVCFVFNTFLSVDSFSGLSFFPLLKRAGLKPGSAGCLISTQPLNLSICSFLSLVWGLFLIDLEFFTYHFKCWPLK